MTDPTDLAARMEHAFADAVEPVRRELAELETRIAEDEARLERLRKLRTRARSLLRTLDPDAPELQEKGKPGRKAAAPVGNGYPVSDEKVEALVKWLREHPDVAAERFSVPRLTEHPDWQKLMSHQTANAALQALTAQGRLRLDRVSGTNRRDYRTTKAFAE